MAHVLFVHFAIPKTANYTILFNLSIARDVHVGSTNTTIRLT
jgi:hypothetical protein